MVATLVLVDYPGIRLVKISTTYNAEYYGKYRRLYKSFVYMLCSDGASPVEETT